MTRTAPLAALLAALFTFALTAGSAVAAPAGSTFLVSRPDGTGSIQAPTDGDSGGPLAVSSGGGRYVAFASAADGFAPGADPAVNNLFLRDTVEKTTTLVSRSDGFNGVGANASVAVSPRDTVAIALVPGTVAADGPHDRPHVLVVFGTAATNLVDHVDGTVPRTEGVEQVWLRDVTAGTTYLISRAPSLNGAPADRRSAHPSLAVGPKGPLVAFESEATNISEFGPEPPIDNVYVRDVEAGKTLLGSCSLRRCGASTSLAPSSEPSLIYEDTSRKPSNFPPCPGGARCALVAFTTADPSIAASPSTGVDHTQVVIGRATERGDSTSLAPFDFWETVSLRSRTASVVGNASSWAPSLPAERYVVGFLSAATNLDDRYTVPANAIEGYTRVLQGVATETSVITLTEDPVERTPVRFPVTHLDLGAAGFFFVGFDTDTGGLGAPAGRANVAFLNAGGAILDRGAGAAGAVGDDTSREATVSEGFPGVAAFASSSRNLGAGGGSDFRRVYRRVVEPSANDYESLELVSRPSGTGPFSPGAMRSTIVPSATSADGRFVAFQSDADNLSAVDDDSAVNVFVRDTVRGTTTLVNRANGANGAAGNGQAELLGISEDGRRVLFASTATNLGFGGAHGYYAYVRDIGAQTTTLASRVNGPTGAPASVATASLSGDGNRVAFTSGSVLDPEAANDVSGHLYVRDLAQQTTTFVDRDNGAFGRAADGVAEAPTIDRRGDRVAWVTFASLPGAGAGQAQGRQIYVRDLNAATTVLASRADGAGGAEANGESLAPSLDAAGDAVAFESTATNLGAAAKRLVWVRRLNSNRTELVSRANGAAGAPADGLSRFPSIDAAGDRVAFMSSGRNLVAVGSGSGPVPAGEAYVRDLGAQATQLVSLVNGAGGAPGQGGSVDAVSITPNGDCVAFAGTGVNYTDALASADFPQVRERVLRGDCGPARVPSTGSEVPPAEPERPAGVAVQAARLSRATVEPSRFFAGGSGGGTEISFVLDRPSRVVISFRRVSAARSARRTDRAAGRLTLRAHRGRNRIHFSGILHGRALRPGRYRWTAAPAHGDSVSGSFVVLRHRRSRRSR